MTFDTRIFVSCLLSLVAVVSSFGPCLAEVEGGSSGATPEAVLVRHCDADCARDWLAVAALVHPDDLWEVKTVAVEQRDRELQPE